MSKFAFIAKVIGKTVPNAKMEKAVLKLMFKRAGEQANVARMVAARRRRGDQQHAHGHRGRMTFGRGRRGGADESPKGNGVRCRHRHLGGTLTRDHKGSVRL